MWANSARRIRTGLRSVAVLAALVEPATGQVSAAVKPLPGTWLTSDGHIKRDVLFWSGTDYVVYSTEDAKTGVMRLVKLDLRTNESSPLLEKNPDSTREFSCSANGKVYAYNTVSGLSSWITVVDRDSNTQTKLPRMGKASWSNWATVSPDGKRVLFVEGAHSIYEYDLVENMGKQSVRQISRNAQHQSDYWPRYSPAGGEVVFVSNRSGDFEIYSMSDRGTAARRLTASVGIDLHAAYSPDGKRIAYTSNRDGNFEIYVMDRLGGGSTRVTHNPERDDFAAWHPNGRQLVVVSEHGGKFDLRQIDAP